MGYEIEVPATLKGAKRVYDEFWGVDFSSPGSMVSPKRSYDAVNVYKNYSSEGANAVETRPGFSLIKTFEGKINGLSIFEGKLFVHHGNKLSLWENFPESTSAQISELFSSMNNAPSVFFSFGAKHYVLDGQNYLVYDGASAQAVSLSAYIPTTRIGAAPSGGGGSFYQEVNLLSPRRKNSFIADGSSVVYKLDACELDGAEVFLLRAWINEEEMSEGNGFSVNRTTGEVSFVSAPGAPATPGTDNVIIEFSKTESSYEGMISGCTVACAFDSRVFLSGNDLYKGRIFHSELDDAGYFRDTAYYEPSSDLASIKALVSGQGVLFAVKEALGGEGVKVFTLTPSLHYELGKVYPVCATPINLGAVGGGIGFMGRLVYLSPMGLEGVRLSENGSGLIHEHLSGFVDPRLTAYSDYDSAKMCLWKNYLIILLSGEMLLADGFSLNKGVCEWFYWRGIGVRSAGNVERASALFSYSDKLYFGCENGAVCVFTGTNDCAQAILSYWCTPMELFGEASRYKKSMKRGGAAQIKRIPNSIIKIAKKTDLSDWEQIKYAATAGFDFKAVDFSLFTFGTGAEGIVAFSPGAEKFKSLSLKFYSDEIDKPFGMYSAQIEAKIKNYVK